MILISVLYQNAATSLTLEPNLQGLISSEINDRTLVRQQNTKNIKQAPNSMQDCLGWFFELVLNICMKIATTNMQTAKSCKKKETYMVVCMQLCTNFMCIND